MKYNIGENKEDQDQNIHGCLELSAASGSIGPHKTKEIQSHGCLQYVPLHGTNSNQLALK